jgi:hypothetical protein
MATVMFPLFHKGDIWMTDSEVRTTALFHLVGSSFGQLQTEVGKPHPPFAANVVCGKRFKHKSGACTVVIDQQLKHVTGGCLPCRYSDHNGLAATLAFIAKEAGTIISMNGDLPPILADPLAQPPILENDDKKKRVDLTISGMVLKEQFIDVTIASPYLGNGGDGKFDIKTGLVYLQKPILAQVAEKNRRYRKRADKAGVDLVVAAVTHLGTMGGQFLQLLHQLASLEARFSVDSVQTIFSRMRRYILAKVFVTVARNAHNAVSTISRHASQH